LGEDRLQHGFGTSCGEQRMVNTPPRQYQIRLDVVWLKIRHFVKYLSGIEASGKEVQDVADTNPHSADAGSSATLLRVDGDTVE